MDTECLAIVPTRAALDMDEVATCGVAEETLLGALKMHFNMTPMVQMFN